MNRKLRPLKKYRHCESEWRSNLVFKIASSAFGLLAMTGRGFFNSLKLYYLLFLYLVLSLDYGTAVAVNEPWEVTNFEGPSLSATARGNPFLSIEEERSFLEAHRVAPILLDYFEVSAIFFSPYESKAIINGMVCKVGDEIGWEDANIKKIVEILPEAVILKDINGIEYILKLNKEGVK